MRIDDFGNVGIGNTNPIGKLDISGAVKGKALTILNETGNQALFTASASGVGKFIIDHSGNVGIGTTSPGAKLEVISDALLSYSQRILVGTGNTLSGIGAGDTALYTDLNNSGMAGVYLSTLDDNSSILYGVASVDVNAVNYFKGNVGIGNASPVGLLDISGAVKGKALVILNETGDQSLFVASASGVRKFSISRDGSISLSATDAVNEGSQINWYGAGSYDNWYTDLNQSNFRIFTNGTNTNQVQIFNASTGTTGLYVQGKTGIGNANSSPVGLLDISGAIKGKALVILNETGDQALFTASAAGVPKFTIDHAGRVGIGTVSPAELLDVVSTGTSANARINLTATGTGTSDGYAALRFGNNLGTGRWAVGIGGGNETVYGIPDKFYILNSATNQVKFVIQPDGNVGIGSGNTSPLGLLDISGAAKGKALVILNESGDQNIFTASASGTEQFRIQRSGGFVGRKFNDLDNPLYFIDPADGGASASIAGDIQMDKTNPTIWSRGTNNTLTLKAGDNGEGEVTIGSGNSKLNAGTIDPPYTINGEKFATYLTSMTGVKEETTGVVSTSSYVPGVGYRTVLSFAEAAKASDLWLFAQVTNITAHFEDLIVLLSPAGNVKTWYDIDPDAKAIVIYTSKPTTVSYRLTAPRFDATHHANTRTNKVIGFVIPSLDLTASSPVRTISQDLFTITQINPSTYSVTNQVGAYIEDTLAGASAVIGSIRAGIISATSATFSSLTATTGTVGSLAVDSLSIGGQNLTDYITDIIKTLPGYRNSDTISPIASDSAGIAISLSGNQTLSITDGTTTNTTIDRQGNISTFGDLTAKNATFSGSVTSDSLTTGNATISGTLSADTIRVNNLETRFGMLQSAATMSAEEVAALASASAAPAMDLSGQLSASVSSILRLFASEPATDSGKLMDLTEYALRVNSMRVDSSLTVTGTTSLGVTSIAGSLIVDGSMRITHSGLESIDGPLYIGKSGGTDVNIANGTLIVRPNGSVAVTGDLSVTGVLGVNTIRPNTDNTVSIDLSDTPATGAGSFALLGLGKSPVATISATGDASFIGAASVAKLNITASASDSGTQIASASAGVALLPAGTDQLTIPTTVVNATSLIYLTPQTSTGNQVLYVKQSIPGTGFTVSIDAPILSDIRFTWWIIN
jgi:hypothetical protein